MSWINVQLRSIKGASPQRASPCSQQIFPNVIRCLIVVMMIWRPALHRHSTRMCAGLPERCEKCFASFLIEKLPFLSEILGSPPPKATIIPISKISCQRSNEDLKTSKLFDVSHLVSVVTG